MSSEAENEVITRASYRLSLASVAITVISIGIAIILTSSHASPSAQNAFIDLGRSYVAIGILGAIVIHLLVLREVKKHKQNSGKPNSVMLHKCFHVCRCCHFYTTLRKLKHIEQPIKKESISLTIIGLIITSVAFGFGAYAVLYQSEPAKLSEVHEVVMVNETNGRLIINVTNRAMFKETGRVFLYKIEANPFKPNMNISSIQSGQTRQFELEINVNKQEITIPQTSAEYKIPFYKLYFVYENEASITYRITCDNCYSEGLLGRVPEGQSVPIQLELKNGTLEGFINVYSWVEFNLQDVLKKD